MYWIEIFKSGTHTDSSGRESAYTPETLDTIASLYNSNVLDNPSLLAPVVKGHPQTNDPAYGWVERLARRGTKLLAQLKDVPNDFINEVREGRYKKISVALYPDLMLKHVGFLGAAAPAVKGMQNVEFDDGLNFFTSDNPGLLTDELSGDEDCDDDEHQSCDFSEYLELIDELNSANDLILKDNERLTSELTELKKEIRFSEYRGFIHELNSQGKVVISPSQTDTLIEIFESAHNWDESNESNFSEGENSGESAVSSLKKFLASLRPSFDLSEFAVKGINQSANDEKNFSGANISSERLMIHRRAKELQEESPALTYEDAVLLAGNK